MFTLSQARERIASASQFARGSAYVQDGCVRGVTVREQSDTTVYEGEIVSGRNALRAMFEYDAQTGEFGTCLCGCVEFTRTQHACRHVAALMIAVCGGAGEYVGARDGSDFMDALLDESRTRPFARVRTAVADEPVRLYPQLRLISGTEMGLSLKIGRTRAYVVRSMAEHAEV